MTEVAMSLDKLDLWLQARIGQGGAATDLSRLDGFVAAIVAGPVSMDPRDWICPLLGVAREAFDHGGTVEFAAISSVAVRHNVIANTLSTTPQDFAPIFGRKPNGDIDAGSWCSGFYAAIQLNPSAWAPLLTKDGIESGLLLPILFHCVDRNGRPLIPSAPTGAEADMLRRSAHTAIPAAVELTRQYWMPTRFKTRP
jgi:uncharacterized protein